MKTQLRPQYDQKKADTFSQSMVENLNRAGLTLMISVCHRTGLFDAMRGMAPSSSGQIAQKAGLNERYVREALGALVTGGVAEYDPEKKTYSLPPEHADFLTRKASPNNMAVTSQWISVLASVEDRIVDCFHKGGGVRYEEYRRFHEVMAEESHQTVVQPLLESILPLAEGLIGKLKQGIRVLDAGCGSGYAVIHIAGHFPRSRFVGYDLCEDAIDRAKKRAREEGVKNVTFEVRDVASVKAGEKFDFIATFDAIHDQADPAGVLKNIYRALKDDGVYLMQEIAGSSDVEEDKAHPIGALLYTVSCMHCMTVSLAQQGKGLGAMWGRKVARKMLRQAGFTRIEIKRLPHDIINDYYVVRK